MNRLDRYILVEWTKSLLLCLLVTLGILILFDLNDDLGDFVKLGAKTTELLHYYFLLSIQFVPVVLPIALLVSLLFTLGTLHRNLEITAMRVAGLSLFRISLFLWIGSLLMAGILFVANALSIPWSVNQTKKIRNQWTAQGLSDSQNLGRNQKNWIYNLTFLDPNENQRWVINRYDPITRDAYGVQVSIFNHQRQEIQRILAQYASFVKEDQRWQFQKGREVKFYSDTGEPYFSLPFEKSSKNWAVSPEMILSLNQPVKNLSFPDLKEVLSFIPKQDQRYLSYQLRYYFFWADPFICIVMVGVTVPFSVRGVRINPLVNMSKSLGLFLIYYPFYLLSETLGTLEIFPPLLAAGFPNILGLSIGAYLFYQHR